MQNALFRKSWILAIIVLFIIASFIPCISGYYSKIEHKSDIESPENVEEQDKSLMTCYTFGETEIKEHESVLASNDANDIFQMFEELIYELIHHPFHELTQKLKHEVVDVLNEKGLIPEGISKAEFISILTPSWIHWTPVTEHLLRDIPRIKSSTGQATARFCSIASGGLGITTPIVILPRPRGILQWSGKTGQEETATVVGELFADKGFIAVGNQNGIAIGFTGAGLTYGTPYGRVYAFTGFALSTTVTAEYIEFYPPNSKPKISNLIPENGQQNIPISLSELSFYIEDDDNDKMSYSVSTHPYIGSGNGQNKGNGKYSIPVEGLQYSTTYSWTITVSDGMDTTEKTFTFTTISLGPVISNPNPPDFGSASEDLTELSFTLFDAQGDLMDYTVETNPDIGSTSDVNVPDGTYTVPIHDLKRYTWYHWYVNVTDGNYWTRESFSFYVSEFGLVGYWSFNEANGDTAYDSSGYDNDGSIYGATWTLSGKINGALEFDGNDYVVVPHDTSLDTYDAFTVAAWFKPTGYTSDDNNHIVTRRGLGYQYSLTIADHYHTGDYCLHGMTDLGEGNIITLYSEPDYVNLNNWFFGVYTYDGSNYRLYFGNETSIDEVDNELNSPIEPPSMDVSLFFGRNAYASGYFKGVIDEVRIYNRALSTSEIQELYNNPDG